MCVCVCVCGGGGGGRVVPGGSQARGPNKVKTDDRAS